MDAVPAVSDVLFRNDSVRHTVECYWEVVCVLSSGDTASK